MSKGSSPRVASVPKEAFNNNWDAIFGKSKPAAGPTYEVKDQSKAEYRIYTSEGQELHAIVYPSSVFGENENIYSTVSVHGYQECVLSYPNVVNNFAEEVKRISIRNKEIAELIGVPEISGLLLSWFTPDTFLNKLVLAQISQEPTVPCPELLLLANIGSLGECRIYSGPKAGLYSMFLLDRLGTDTMFFNIDANKIADIEKKMIARIDLTTEWLRQFGFVAEKTEAQRG